MPRDWVEWPRWSVVMLGLACGGEMGSRTHADPVEQAPSQVAEREGVGTPRAEAEPEPAPPEWSDAWLLLDAERFFEDRTFRRAQLEASLTHHDNMYSRARLGSYARERGGWDVLPEWIPWAQPLTPAVVDALRAGKQPTLEEATLLWDGQRPATMAQWVALGRRVFFEYPLRPEVFAEHALAHPDVARRVGLRVAPDGTWPGLVVFRDLDTRARVGITCALCHVAVPPEGPVVIGAARRDLDYGEMRLAYHRDTGAPLPERLAERMAQWGLGRADITQDDDSDPVAIPDLWGIRGQPFLTQAGTLRHDHPAALAIRQETQILHANRERTRPPRELAWALAMYVYSLDPPAREAVPFDARAQAGQQTFARECVRCHDHPSGSGVPVKVQRVGTDPTLALGRERGTGLYRPSPLVRVADAGPYLHHGAIRTLEDLLDPARLIDGYTGGTLGPGAVPGHAFGTDLSEPQRAELVAYLRTW